MGRPEFSLFYHPTTTVYIDDNKDFLNTLTMKAEPGSCKIFDDPHEGLAYIESQFKLIENFSKGEPLSPDINTPNKLVLPQNQVCKKLNTLNRFAEPSVVVVDFSMPELNGLDLCAQLTNPNTKKVLLTGVANEQQAIQALNADLIDVYIRKDQEELKRLPSIVSTLNSRYFTDLVMLSNHETKLQIPFLFDAEFADYFEQLCEDLGTVEYYYVTNPGGFLLIDKFGTISRLIVLTKEELRQTIDDAGEQGASNECMNCLRENTHIPFFQNDDGEFEPTFMDEWSEHIYPLIRVENEQEFFCALIEKEFKCLTSYQEYLDMPSYRLH